MNVGPSPLQPQCPLLSCMGGKTVSVMGGKGLECSVQNRMLMKGKLIHSNTGKSN